MKKIEKETSIEIMQIKLGRLRCNLLGTTPLYMHRFGSKGQKEILLPSPKKNAAEKASTLKHDPIAEFREATYFNRDVNTPTAFHLPTGMFAKALASAAIDIPGAKKSQMQRLTSITSTTVFLYGIPELDIKMVRMSDIGRTPDMRSRPLFKEWACTIDVDFVASLTKEGQIANLLSAAGILVGIGDNRPQKGGSNGKFKIVPNDDRDFQRILKTGGRQAQLQAYKNPKCADEETEELFRWYLEETKRREKVVPSSLEGNGFDPVVAQTKNKTERRREARQ